MSTFHPPASSLANFNDTLPTISTIWLIYISCSHQDKNQHLSWHPAHTLWGVHGEHQVNTENLHQIVETKCMYNNIVAVPRYQLLTTLLANYKGTISTISTTRLFCHVHVLPKECRGLGCGQILPSLLSAYWVISSYFLAVLEISICRAYSNTCNRDAMLLVASQLHVLQQGARVCCGHASKLCIRRYYVK